MESFSFNSIATEDIANNACAAYPPQRLVSTLLSSGTHIPIPVGPADCWQYDWLATDIHPAASRHVLRGWSAMRFFLFPTLYSALDQAILSILNNQTHVRFPYTLCEMLISIGTKVCRSLVHVVPDWTDKMVDMTSSRKLPELANTRQG